jgi:hypothetical protein
MKIRGKQHSFESKSINKSPKKSGIYVLYKEDNIIYYGKASNNIRKRLQSHLRGDEGLCTQSATHYKRQPTSKPAKREKRLLAAYEKKHGSFPHCNERSV